MAFFNIYRQMGVRKLAMPTRLLSLPPIASTYQTRALSRLPDIHYYLAKGLEGVDHQEYRDIHSFTRAIDSNTSQLCSGNADESLCQYIVFSPVTKEELYKIEHLRNTHYKGLRFHYLNDPKALIVKIMVSKIHELVHRQFGRILIKKVEGMHLGRALLDIGSATYTGTAGRKQADGAYIPQFTRNYKTDWPTLVFECGVSQYAPSLKAGGRWWLENSSGQVNIALLFFVSKLARTIRIEQWVAETVPNPQATEGRSHLLTITPQIGDAILIDAHSITGGTLDLSFKKIFLREPVAAKGETNFTFTEQDLRDYYDDVWRVRR